MKNKNDKNRMTAQQLKDSILQMAVQGKLVQQDQNDEPASVLLEKIRTEKAKLVKEGKIKKDKNESIIYRGADNTTYEKIGDTVTDISDQIPFDVPEGWEWCRLVALTSKEIKRGKSPKYSTEKGIQVFAQKCNVKNGGINMTLAKYLDPITFEKYSEEEYLQDQDIIINSTGNGTLGRIGIFRDADRIDKSIIVPDSHVAIVRLQPSFNKDFLLYVLTYYQPYLEKLGEGSTNQTELKPAVIADLFVPIPPLSEQHRIVSKIEQLLPYIDHYDETEQKLTTLNAEFPDKLKKSILQIAVQGKLAPQNPTDEPASVLLEKIRAEKENLIKQGKIKRDKNESVIYKRDKEYFEKQNGVEICISDQIPFEIPEGWEWCRLGSVVEINPRNKIDDNVSVSFVPMALIADGYNNLHTSQNKLWKDVKSGFTHFAENDVAFAKITPCFENRKSVIMKNLNNAYGAGTTELHIIRAYNGLIFNKYLLWFCKSAYFIDNGVKAFSGTAGQQRVGKEYVSTCLFPLPSLSEQHRIVAKIDELLSLCNTLT